MAQHIVVTPHPLTTDGQQHLTGELLPGQSLYAFLAHNAPMALDGGWAVSIGGRQVPVEIWHKVFPKDGNLIEVRSTVDNKQAWSLIAVLVLSYFTFGVAGAGGFVAGAYGTTAASAVFLAGSILINKVLAPKPPKSEFNDTSGGVLSLAGAQNATRPYEPLAIPFGVIRVAPDLYTKPYTFFAGDDQYLVLGLTPGINVDRIENVMNGDNPLTNYEGVRLFYNGMPSMPKDGGALWSDVDSQPGGALQDEDKNVVSVIRTTSPNTIRIQVDVEYTLFAKGKKGNELYNQVFVTAEYRPVGGGGWTLLERREANNKDMRTHRMSLAGFVPAGQYDVRVSRTVARSTGENDVATFNWTTLSSVQKDNASYAGIARVDILLKATGQLSGTPNEMQMTIYAKPIQVWDGQKWVLANTRELGLSNPGAQMLAYIRGYYDENGKLIGGMGLSDMFIDIPAFQAFMLHCKNNNYTYDYYLKETRTHEEVLSSIALAGFGQFTNADGKISVAWASSNQPQKYTVNMSNIKKGQFSVDYSLNNTADGIELTYFDRDIWDTTTLRVSAPGVQTPLNPARITAEGVTSANHAAEMARYHLGQTLYQYKEINYSTDLEHMLYRRMSVLSLSHDMTQWGFSGSILSAKVINGVVTLQLDTEVPPPANDDAYIGLRVPGEMTYRVMAVQPFAAPSTVIRLKGAWPLDAVFPGVGENNPAWDTKYCYDFKRTPGYNVRVVSITPDADMKGAQVTVVPESEEFWNYVKTGNYIPAPNGSSLSTRPVVSDLKVTEGQVVQGNTVYTELTATFEVTGPYDHADILMSNPAGEMVVQTTTNNRTASWRIPGAGVYTVTVRPFNPDGIAGTAASVIFATKGADAPPVKPDAFDVQQLSGGLRRYVWEFGADTIQSADFAGVEIRYIAGSVSNPVWENMFPVGGANEGESSGFHTAAFDSPTPPSGVWTFSLRAVNTSGTLSTGALTITRTLGKNLGELISQINNDVSQAIVDSFKRDEEEARARAEAIRSVTAQIDEEVRAREEQAQDIIDATNASIAQQAADLLNESNERKAAIQQESSLRQAADQSLAYQISTISAGTGMQFDSKRIWYFDNGNEGWTGTATGGYLDPGSASTVSPTGLGIDGKAYRYVKMRLLRRGSPTWAGAVSWKSAGGAWVSAPLTEPVWDAQGTGTADLSDIPWQDITVDQIRVKLAGTPDANNNYLLDWVAIGRPTPGASVALVEELRQAMVEADASEALKRSTLAVQLRGDYEGTDLASLTSGLVYEERKARVTATGAISSRVDGLQVAIDGKASAQALETLTVKVDQIDGEVSSISESVFSLESQLDGESAGETDWNAGEDDIYAGAKTVYTVITEGDLATARQIDTVRTEFGQFKAETTQEFASVASEFESNARLFDQVRADLGTKASSTSVNALTARVTTAESSITTNAQAIAQVDSKVDTKASASALSALQTTVSDINGKVTSSATAITQVQAALDGKAAASTVFELSAQVSAQGNIINSQALLALNSNGYIGGYKIGNNGSVVDFTVLSDKFRIVSPTGGARFEYSNGTIRVYDENNVLRVALGLL